MWLRLPIKCKCHYVKIGFEVGSEMLAVGVCSGQAQIKGKQTFVCHSGQETNPPWLDNIQDTCIIGLDLLIHIGAHLDIPHSAIDMGMTSLALRQGLPENQAKWQNQSADLMKGLCKGQKEQGLFKGCPEPTPPPPQPATPLVETVQVVGDLWQCRSEGFVI